MTAFISGLLILILLMVIVVVIGVDNLRRETQRVGDLLEEIKGLQLNPRTRIGTLAPRSGAVSQEQELTKLGRASAARRVVVGGDPDSRLNTDLTTTLKEDNDG